MPIQEYDVAIEGIGRVDYSNAVEVTTEPVITSWQNVYTDSALVAIPALGSTVVDLPITSDLVVIIYDFFASIPSNRLIRLEVIEIDSAGLSVTVLRETKYQTIAAHMSRGRKFQNRIQFVVYNYAPVPEPAMQIGAAGIFTTEQEFYLSISPGN